MKSKILKWLIALIVILLILMFGILSFSRIKEKKTAEKNTQSFHDFCAFSVGDYQKFCTESLPVKSILMLFMNPDCDFCKEEIKQIKERQNDLKNISILLISVTSQKQTADFYSDYQLNQFNNIQLLIDDNFKISRYFDINGYF